jgi:hypothetical protein
MPSLGGAIILPSAARTVTTAADVQLNTGSNGLMFWLTISAIAGGSPGASTTGIRIKLYVPAPYARDAMLLGGDDSSYIRKTGTWGWLWYPGATIVQANGLGSGGEGNIVFARPMAIPAEWYAEVEPLDATSFTYALEYSLISV